MSPGTDCRDEDEDDAELPASQLRDVREAFSIHHKIYSNAKLETPHADRQSMSMPLFKSLSSNWDHTPNGKAKKRSGKGKAKTNPLEMRPSPPTISPSRVRCGSLLLTRA